jgi:hypothetical protein
MNTSLRSLVVFASVAGALVAGAGCSGGGSGGAALTDLDGHPFSVDSITSTITADGFSSRIDVGGRFYDASFSSTPSGPRFECVSEDGTESMALTDVDGELDVTAMSEVGAMTSKLHAPDAPADLDALRALVASSPPVRFEADTLTLTLPLSVLVAQSWGDSPESDSARSMLAALTTALANWSPLRTVSPLELVDDPRAPPTCSGGGGTCTCAPDQVCVASSFGCGCGTIYH